MKTFIYVLKDPETSEVRYVGKSNNPHKRLISHLNRNKDVGTHKRNWLNTLSKKPILQIIEEVEVENWVIREKFHIDYYLSIGCKLVNWSGGGEGLTYGNQTSFRKNQGNKKIISIYKDGTIFKEFESQKLLCEYFNAHPGGFYNVLKKKRRFYCGFNYLYYDEYINMSHIELTSHIFWLNNYADKSEIGKRVGFKKGHKTWKGAKNNLKIPEGKEIGQYTLDEKLIRVWKNSAVAGRILNIKSNNINMCANRKRKSAGGFIWRYEAI